MGEEQQPSPDIELEAIQAVLTALGPLEHPARDRVIAYVFNRLGLTPSTSPGGRPAGLPLSPLLTDTAETSPVPSLQVTDVRTLATNKKPSTVQERVAVIAFYVSELAPANERKPEISAADLTKYLKQANLPIPTRPRQALLDAKNAGYLDGGSTRGTYKLNPVGYNLVAHKLPATQKSD